MPPVFTDSFALVVVGFAASRNTVAAIKIALHESRLPSSSSCCRLMWPNQNAKSRALASNGIVGHATFAGDLDNETGALTRSARTPHGLDNPETCSAMKSAAVVFNSEGLCNL